MDMGGVRLVKGGVRLSSAIRNSEWDGAGTNATTTHSITNPLYGGPIDSPNCALDLYTHCKH